MASDCAAGCPNRHAGLEVFRPMDPLVDRAHAEGHFGQSREVSTALDGVARFREPSSRPSVIPPLEQGRR